MLIPSKDDTCQECDRTPDWVFESSGYWALCCWEHVGETKKSILLTGRQLKEFKKLSISAKQPYFRRLHDLRSRTRF